MKRTLLLLLGLYLFHYSAAQPNGTAEYAIIITTDGFRWQEVFNGMDSSIASSPKFNQKDSLGIFKKYWAQSARERRKKLMPFVWSTIAGNGQIYGNRPLGVKVNNANPYWFSYPGYSEIFCGNVDTAINSNAYRPNPNTTLLEFLNKQGRLKGKVAAFCAWDAFDRIFNEARAGFPVVCGNDKCGGNNPDAEQRLINEMKQSAYTPWDAEALDVFTHYAAMDHLRKKQPGLLYISYGETDEWAHEGHYKDYLNAANRVDAWVGEIWQFVQNSPKYSNKTLLFLTVDHGRGRYDEWTSHSSSIAGADEMWFAVMGPQILAKGEISGGVQLYQKQFAQTIANSLGYLFKCEHPVAPGIELTGGK